MPEYITKEAVKQAMRSQPRGILFTEWELDQVPTVDAMEVVHGRWEQGDMYDYGDVCSRCDWDSSREPCRYHYCPNCGAKMDGGINK